MVRVYRASRRLPSSPIPRNGPRTQRMMARHFGDADEADETRRAQTARGAPKPVRCRGPPKSLLPWAIKTAIMPCHQEVLLSWHSVKRAGSENCPSPSDIQPALFLLCFAILGCRQVHRNYMACERAPAAEARAAAADDRPPTAPRRPTPERFSAQQPRDAASRAAKRILPQRRRAPAGRRRPTERDEQGKLGSLDRVQAPYSHTQPVKAWARAGIGCRPHHYPLDGALGLTVPWTVPWASPSATRSVAAALCFSDGMPAVGVCRTVWGRGS